MLCRLWEAFLFSCSSRIRTGAGPARVCWQVHFDQLSYEKDEVLTFSHPKLCRVIPGTGTQTGFCGEKRERKGIFAVEGHAGVGQGWAGLSRLLEADSTLSETWQTEATYRISILHLSDSWRIIRWHNSAELDSFFESLCFCVQGWC